MQRGIFISYRRSENADIVDRLRDGLSRKYPAGDIFVDIDGLRPGADFRDELMRAISRSSVMLAVIGPEWNAVEAATGRRRIDDPEDFVRREIKAALDARLTVIPVLVGDAKMPTRDEVPADLEGLVWRQAITLSRRHFKTDLSILMRAVGAAIPPRSGPLKWIAAGAALPVLGATALALALGWRPWPAGQPHQASVPAAVDAVTAGSADKAAPAPAAALPKVSATKSPAVAGSNPWSGTWEIEEEIFWPYAGTIPFELSNRQYYRISGTAEDLKLEWAGCGVPMPCLDRAEFSPVEIKKLFHLEPTRLKFAIGGTGTTSVTIYDWGNLAPDQYGTPSAEGTMSHDYGSGPEHASRQRLKRVQP